MLHGYQKQAAFLRLPARKTANKHYRVINKPGVFHQMNID